MCTMNLDTATASTNRSSTFDYSDVYAGTLHRACDKLGGTAALARDLGMRADAVQLMLQGRTRIPHSVFLHAVDILLLRGITKQPANTALM
jgi:hypothetical protein